MSSARRRSNRPATEPLSVTSPSLTLTSISVPSTLGSSVSRAWTSSSIRSSERT